MVTQRVILAAFPNVLKTVNVPSLGEKYQGKVRDFYMVAGKRTLITTDRQSAFDVILGHVPFKGAVLNLLSRFWFEKTKDIVRSHMIAVPDPNVMIVHDCQPIPVEMIVRGYISGVTKTSVWYSYEKGERIIYGIKFPDGLKKNQKLPKPVITPTTHGAPGAHDERLTREQIIKRKIVPKKLYEQMEKVSLELFDFGSKFCQRRGLILVDTKYELGLHKGKLMIIDEIHTPDSSRFWKADSYQGRFKKGLEPENFDKEFLRLWYAKRGYRGDGPPPKMPKELVVALAKRYIAVYETITGKKFKGFPYPIENRIIESLTTSQTTYTQVGDNYETKDPVKKLALQAAKRTSNNLKRNHFSEISSSRGESAYVWQQGNILMASVVEGLGTKNLVADGMRTVTGKTYYDVIGHDTVATVINDLISVGATPLAIHAYWAMGDSQWLSDRKRLDDLIRGWANACDIAGVSWGGGETPTLRGIIERDAVDLAGSAVGIIRPQSRLITDKNLRVGDRILLLKSSGINANGLSLARAVAKKLPKGYETKLADGKMYGDSLLTKTHIYSRLLNSLFVANIYPHYVSNITGHGLRKIMRGRPAFTYVIEKIVKPQPVFTFIQKHAGITDYEMYETFNMGMDYAIFVDTKDASRAGKIIKDIGFDSIDAGRVEKGKKQVIFKLKGIMFEGETLDLR